ncbi:hypothetical protein MBAV_002204 [Candidatus Magnetobacterium bavaricum]|uniref:Uncharacterized protein n=1 Tax=Candidatus Magnetobacterium bavaricum TaxID=29290 RepID=A0A0F3GUF9_9BACT|nr:hypothetical protein MBAV_002204 [Candidatus Magnetobacterium bavaricum]
MNIRQAGSRQAGSRQADHLKGEQVHEVFRALLVIRTKRDLDIQRVRGTPLNR